ncbi:GNAT family N-acetyltransferase [Actinoplanes sp. CA-142083]|uniref:GNAT family N-acetyltransferase n=1 Tax=Actinoplanes sp. CA-142083 TaxID=3239903 RepID=UPI003D8DF6F7
MVARWAAGQPGARIWERPDAIAVACANLSRRDRLAIHGEPEAVARLLSDEVLANIKNTYRPIGAEEVIVSVAELIPGFEVDGKFGWMDVTAPVPAAKTSATWLHPDELPRVAALIEQAFPDSYAKPGAPGVERWAGIRGDDGTLLAVAADAWSTAEIGLLAGVATRPEARGRGLARQLCAFVTNELLAGRERVGLMVDYWNVGALNTYAKLGFDLKRVAAARLNEC